jgi:uridylate kinase
MDNSKHIVISLGGSLIVPEGIDTAFLNSFVSVVKDYVVKGYRFVIITGGGKIARNYVESAQGINHPSNDDLDWIGIATTRLNAEFLRVLFGELSYNEIILNPDAIPTTDKPVLVGGGWKPGNSSDLAAVHAAASVNAGKVINLSNIDYAYNKDPKKFSDAVKIEESTWEDFRKILPLEWNPGLNSPFDPVAAEKAQILGLEVAIMNGKNIENLKDYLDGKSFLGTVIK